MSPSRFRCSRVRHWTPLIAAICIGIFGSVPLQARQYLLRTWQTDQGLPQNSIQSLCQTADGYLWIGSQDGLARFDGIQFKNYDSVISAEPPSRWVTALHQDNSGAFWVGTDGKGLLKVKDGKITRYGSETGLVSDAVRTICEARDGSVWIGTAHGLSKYHNGKLTNFTAGDGLVYPVVRALCEDSHGNVWAGTGTGLQKFSGGDFVRSEIFRLNSGLPSPSVRCLLADTNGILWIGSNSGLARYEGGQFATYTQKDGLLDLTVSALLKDSRGNLWVGTYGGLHRFQDGKLVPEKTASGAIFDTVYALVEDREGNIWVGTNAGLLQLKQRRFISLTKDDGLSHNSTVSVCQDQQGSIWLGTWGGALNEFRDGQILHHKASDVLPFSLMLGLHATRDGSLWFGTDYDGGLYRRMPDGNISRWGKEHGLPHPAISVIHEDRSGTIWIGTRAGLVCFKDGQFTHYATVDGLPGAAIKALAEDRDGNLWVGTTTGLAVRRNQVFQPIGADQGLSNTPIFALHFDADGALWIGTKGNGLHRFRNGQFKAYTTKDGLFHNDIFEILEHKGAFWLTCSRGVSRVSTESFEEYDQGLTGQLRAVVYGKADGMDSVDCKGVAKPAACIAADGRLWFATGKGFMVAEPDIELNYRVPPVYVHEVVFDKTEPATASIDLPVTEISIPPGSGDVEIGYTALSLQSPEKNRFKYKLEGVDADWVDAGSRRTAYYNNLPPGDYRFQVIACNNDGIWNETGAQLAMTVEPHLWQTWWAQAGMFFVTAGVIGGIFRARISRFREIEKLRIRIAGDLHDEVGSSLWSISLLSRMLHKSTALTPDDKRDTEEINRIALQTANSIRDIVWFINPEYDTTQDLLLRMRDVAQTMLGGIDYRMEMPQENLSRKLPLDFRQNVFLMFKESLANIVKHARATCVHVQISETAKGWRMIIRDNGIGFDPAKAAAGNGLKNLQRRAEKLNGELKIESRPGIGTSVCFTTPLG